MFQKFTSGVKQLPFKKTGEGGGVVPLPKKAPSNTVTPGGQGQLQIRKESDGIAKRCSLTWAQDTKKGQKIVTFWMYIFYLPRKKASKTEFVPKGWKSNRFIDITYKSKT